LARRRHLLILLAVQAAAFWPVWRWLLARLGDGEAGAIAAGAAALLIAPPRTATANEGSAGRALGLAAALTLAYAATVPFAPPLASAMVAAPALLATWSAWRWGRVPHPAAAALVVLALPALPTAQFVLGFPLRAAAGELAAGMLSMAGLAVARDGVSLRAGDRLVAIDAPCSGVNMLWTALLVALALAALARLPAGRTAVLALSAAALAVAGNALRAAALFLTESGLLTPPAGFASEGALHSVLHPGAGLVAFALALAPLVWLAWRWQSRREVPLCVR